MGKNNAGKSTCVEALRLVSLVTERLANLSWKRPPKGAEIPTYEPGVSPSLNDIVIHKECLFHHYGDPPALVSALFSNGTKISVHIGLDLAIHAVIYDARGRAVKSRSAALSADIPRVSILPQIGPLAEEETRLSDDRVRRNLLTSFASSHFRNQLRLLRDDYFDDFCHRSSSTWPKLKIASLDVPSLLEKDGRISLIVRDGDFSAEVAWMGHGLQMWLQTMWFMTRNTQSSVLILDEPDVYLHADLQRKLARMLLADERQFIIATHSPEIMAEVAPESIVVLDKQKTKSEAVTSVKAVQRLLIDVGSVHNLSLVRLASQRRILFIEGEDIPILKAFQNVLFPNTTRLIDTIPHSDIGGWSGWPSVLNFAHFLRQNANSEFDVFCLLDRDYHTTNEINARLKQASQASVNLHIWSAKELENYAVVPAAIARLLSKELKRQVDVAEVEEAITKYINSTKDDTFDACSEAERILEPKLGVPNANRKARPEFTKRWQAANGLHVVGGKNLLSTIAKWAQDTHSKSFSIFALIREIRANEVAPEVTNFIKKVTE